MQLLEAVCWHLRAEWLQCTSDRWWGRSTARCHPTRCAKLSWVWFHLANMSMHVIDILPK